MARPRNERSFSFVSKVLMLTYFRALLVLTLALGVAQPAITSPSLALAQQPKAIAIGLGQEPDRLYNSDMFVSTLVGNLLFDGLVGVDDQQRLYPALAEQVPSFDNGLATYVGEGADRHLEVTFPLRQGVTWSDGVPFTADDVVYQYQLMLNPNSGFTTRLEEKYSDVVKLDDYTVKTVFLSANQARQLDPDRYRDQGDEPVVDPLFMFGLNYDDGYIYPSHKLREVLGDDPRNSPAVGTLENSDFARSPVGTGPYTLESWQPGAGLRLVSRGLELPQRLGRPSIDVVTFLASTSKDALLGGLAAGELQLVAQDSLDAADAPTLDALPGVQPFYQPGTAWEQLTFNLDNPILADSRVRHGIAFAINRQALVDDALYGKARVANGPLAAWPWATKAELQPFDFNPGLADQLLRQAGWNPGADGIRVNAAGERLSLRYWSTPSGARPRLMRMVRDQLLQVGVEVTLDFVPSLVFFDDQARSDRALAARAFDVAQFTWVGGFDPGVDAEFWLHSRNIPSRANGFRGGNYPGYRDARTDQLLDQGLSSVDAEFRRGAYGELQDRWRDALPILPLYLRPATFAAASNLLNLRPTGSSMGETWNVEQWDLASPAEPAAP